MVEFHPDDVVLFESDKYIIYSLSNYNAYEKSKITNSNTAIRVWNEHGMGRNGVAVYRGF